MLYSVSIYKGRKLYALPLHLRDTLEQVETWMFPILRKSIVESSIEYLKTQSVFPNVLLMTDDYGNTMSMDDWHKEYAHTLTATLTEAHLGIAAGTKVIVSGATPNTSTKDYWFYDIFFNNKDYVVQGNKLAFNDTKLSSPKLYFKHYEIKRHYLSEKIVCFCGKVFEAPPPLPGFFQVYECIFLGDKHYHSCGCKTCSDVVEWHRSPFKQQLDATWAKCSSCGADKKTEEHRSRCSRIGPASSFDVLRPNYSKFIAEDDKRFLPMMHALAEVSSLKKNVVVVKEAWPTTKEILPKPAHSAMPEPPASSPRPVAKNAKVLDFHKKKETIVDIEGDEVKLTITPLLPDTKK